MPLSSPPPSAQLKHILLLRVLQAYKESDLNYPKHLLLYILTHINRTLYSVHTHTRFDAHSHQSQLYLCWPGIHSIAGAYSEVQHKVRTTFSTAAFYHFLTTSSWKRKCHCQWSHYFTNLTSIINFGRWSMRTSCKQMWKYIDRQRERWQMMQGRAVAFRLCMGNTNEKPYHTQHTQTHTVSM